MHRKSAFVVVFYNNFTNILFVSVSSATWDDESDSGASDWRCAHSGCSHHVFHPEACMFIYIHLYLSFFLLCPQPTVL